LTSAKTARLFDPSGSAFTERHYLKETLTYNSGAGEYALTDTTGNVLKFNDFSTGRPANQRGQLKSFTDAKGNVTSVTACAPHGPGRRPGGQAAGGAAQRDGGQHDHHQAVPVHLPLQRRQRRPPLQHHPAPPGQRRLVHREADRPLEASLNSAERTQIQPPAR